jgi:hypothetical protein
MKEVDINTLKEGYLDLSDYAAHVRFFGKYKGGRIIIKGASKKTLFFDGCIFESTRRESDKDMIAFAGNVTDCKLLFQDSSLIYGGLTFWGQLNNVLISGAKIYYSNTGIRISQDFSNKDVTIEKNLIVGAQREGIYFGPHYNQEEKSDGLSIKHNEIRFCGWDAIQVNAENAIIYHNTIDNAAILKEKNQDYGITIQSGSLVYVYDNIFINTPKKLQALDSRYFTHAPGA